MVLEVEGDFLLELVLDLAAPGLALLVQALHRGAAHGVDLRPVAAVVDDLELRPYPRASRDGLLLRCLAQLVLDQGCEDLQVFHLQLLHGLLGGGEERRANGPVSVLVIRAAALGLRRHHVIVDSTASLRCLLAETIRQANENA